MSKGIFKKCDIRGIYPDELNPDLALRIGRAIGTKLTSGCVVAGDVRPSTPKLKDSLIKGLIQTGCEVVDIGIVPTPVVYFAKEKLNVEGAVIVTASHNPPEYNGFKFMLGDIPPTDREIEEIKKITFNRSTIKKGKGRIYKKNALIPYEQWITKRFSHLSSLINKKGKFKVIVDAGNGCWGGYAERIMRKVNIDVFSIFSNPDGNFPNRSPNSALEENLTAVKNEVSKNEADLGIAFDGDGDRVSFIDDEGRFVPADEIISLFVRWILSSHPGEKIVYDIKCSSIVPDSVKKMGGLALVEKSGHTYIKSRLIRENAIFGGEISGHFFFGELKRDDALFACFSLIEILLRKKKKLSSLRKNLPSYFITPDIRIKYKGEDRERIVKEISSFFKSSYPVEEIDGVKIKFEDGWGLIRVSVTEPLFTFRFESTGKEGVLRIAQRLIPHLPREVGEKILQILDKKYIADKINNQ